MLLWLPNTWKSNRSLFNHCWITFCFTVFFGIFSYYKIFLKTDEHQHNVVSSLQNRSENGSVTNSVREIKLTRMLLLVAAGFLCCWIPMWVFVLWFRFSPETSSRITVLLAVFFLYLSASINLIIYAFTNGEFRREFRKLLFCRRERSINVPKKAVVLPANDLVEREEQEANF